MNRTLDSNLLEIEVSDPEIQRQLEELYTHSNLKVYVNAPRFQDPRRLKDYTVLNYPVKIPFPVITYLEELYHRPFSKLERRYKKK